MTLNSVDDKFEDCVRKQIWIQVRAQIGSYVWGQIWFAVCDEVQGQDHIWSWVRNQVDET